MRTNYLLGTLFGMLSLAGCTKDGSKPAVVNPGRRVFVAPSNERVLSYVEATTVSTDQSTWVAASYTATNASLLLARLDTLGQLLVGRSLAIPFISSLAALPDGGLLVLGGNSSSQPALARLGADGAAIWSKQLGVPQLGSTSFFPGKVVALGNEALLYGIIGNKEFAFSRVSSEGVAQPYVSYQLPSQYFRANSQSADFIALPGGKGAVLLYQTDESSFVLATLTAAGELVWLRQLNSTDLAPTPNVPRVQLAVSASTGNIVVAIAPRGAGAGSELQVVRISAGGDLLNTVNYSVSDNTAPIVGRLAMDSKEQMSWTAESVNWLYYYAIDAQGNTQIAKKLSPAPTYTTTIALSAYGVVRKTTRGAYALGTLAGPLPANAPKNSINMLVINADGQAGCPQDAAPSLVRVPVSGTQLIVLSLPVAATRTTTVIDYALPTAPLSLTTSSACQ